MGTPSLPFHRYSTVVNFTQAGEGIVIDPSQFSGAYFILEGIDCVNNPVTETNQLNLLVQGSGPAATAGDLFQAIVYATSQGYFAWRGEAVIFPGFTVNAVIESGEWSVFAWGHVEPAYTLGA